MPTAADEPPPFPFKGIEYPSMPASEPEWRAHWAFYKLTVAQRDAAWRENKELRQLLEHLGPRTYVSGPAEEELIDDLADVLVHMVVGWEERLGVDLAQHPEVLRVMARYRAAKEVRT